MIKPSSSHPSSNLIFLNLLWQVLLLYILIVKAVKPLAVTTPPQQPVFQNTKSFQVRLLYLEPLVSDCDISQN